MKPITKPTMRMDLWSKDLRQALELFKDNDYDEAIEILNCVISQMQAPVEDCSHTWYMREKGITCTKCLVVWDRSMG
jgi:hypothetical protein